MIRVAVGGGVNRLGLTEMVIIELSIQLSVAFRRHFPASTRRITTSTYSVLQLLNCLIINGNVMYVEYSNK